MDRQKILDALELIKDICTNCEDCENCPFCSENLTCMFRKGNVPQDWKFNSVNDVWRAFTK